MAVRFRAPALHWGMRRDSGARGILSNVLAHAPPGFFHLDATCEQVEMDLAQCKRDIEPLESGTLRQFTRKEGELQWVEITDRIIAFHKRNMALYAVILAHLSDSESQNAK
jgi:hypothetical protein